MSGLLYSLYGMEDGFSRDTAKRRKSATLRGSAVSWLSNDHLVAQPGPASADPFLGRIGESTKFRILVQQGGAHLPPGFAIGQQSLGGAARAF